MRFPVRAATILSVSLGLAGSAHAEEIGHGSVYSAPARSGAVLSVQPGTDAFFKVFEGFPELKLQEMRAIQYGIAIGEEPGQDNADNLRIPAGFTFLGQFLDHDMTLNNGVISIASPDIPAPAAIAANAALASVAINQRSGTFDLDSAYGHSVETIVAALKAAVAQGVCTGGAASVGCVQPTRQLALYELDASNRPTGRFLLGTGEDQGPDLPRCADRDWAPQCASAQQRPMAAIIADGRNDENVIVAQLHLLFLRAHNKLYEQHRRVEPGAPVAFNEASFRYARRVLTEHYHSIIRDEYVPLQIGLDHADAIRRNGFHFYNRSGSTEAHCSDDVAQIPHEFAIGAFRFGHSQVRGGYRMNGSQGGAGGFGALFGDQRLTANTRIEWERFFTLANRTADAPQPSKRIDTLVSQPLASLLAPFIAQEDALSPGETIADKPLASLAIRNLVRATPAATGPGGPNTGNMRDRFPLVSGEEAAKELLKRNIPELVFVPLTADQLSQTLMARPAKVSGAFGGTAPAVGELPLWAYALAEAEVFNGGARLGPVGGRIVGEVFLGLLDCDDAGISRDPRWRPSLPSSSPASFSMADLVRFVEGR